MHLWLAALVGLIGGIGLGYLVFYALHGRRSDGRSAAQVQEELDAYREEVQQHFTRTSDLFQHMTTQYRELYDHLAQGAQSLCDTIPATPELDLSERELLPRREEVRNTAPTSTTGKATAAGDADKSASFPD